MCFPKKELSYIAFIFTLVQCMKNKYAAIISVADNKLINKVQIR